MSRNLWLSRVSLLWLHAHCRHNVNVWQVFPLSLTPDQHLGKFSAGNQSQSVQTSPVLCSETPDTGAASDSQKMLPVTMSTLGFLIEKHQASNLASLLQLRRALSCPHSSERSRMHVAMLPKVLVLTRLRFEEPAGNIRGLFFSTSYTRGMVICSELRTRQSY